MCAVSGCGISSGNKQRVRVHAFQGASSQFRRLWINFVTTTRKDFVLRDSYHGICGRHFEEHSFQDQHTWKVKVEAEIRVRRRLKEDAVPTIITEKCIKALSVHSPAASASLKRNSDTDSVRSKRAKLRGIKKDIAEHQVPLQVQVSAQQPYALRQTAPVARRQKLPDKITCGICRKNFTSPPECAEHMKMHSRARSANLAVRPGTGIPGSSVSGQRPRTSVDRLRTAVHTGRGDGVRSLSGKRVSSAPFAGRHKQPSHQVQRAWSAEKPSSEECGKSCFFCQAEFPDIMSLSKHSRVHGGATPYSCTKCGQMFALYSSLMTHEKSHVPDRPPACRCHKCGSLFLQESSLKAHLRRHEEATEAGPESKPYQCVTCHEWISNEGSLRIHMQRHETADASRTCTLCGSTFSSDVILRAHVKLHESEPTNRCVICIRPFRRSRILLRHSDVHADERHNVCDSCEKRFPKVADGSWRRMQLLLPQERQFQCLYCGERFNRLFQLAAHESGHTDLPPSSGNGDLRPPVVVVN